MRHPLFSLLGIQRISAARLARRRRPGQSASSVEDLEIRQLLAADVRLIRDISPGNSSSNPSQLTNVGGTLFFTAEKSAGDVELWKSDGSSTGTKLVRDILSGPDGSSPRQLTSVNGILYFSARNVLNAGFELWRSDGTESGTWMVRDIRPGDAGAQLGELTDVNGTLYFSATDGTGGIELWKSDGTTAGTVLVKDILPGSGSSNPKHLTNVNGTLFFAATDGVHGTELWKSDGTADGTVMVEDSVVGSKGANPAHLTDVNGTLFYTSFFNVNQGLWKSDGTEDGTTVLRVFAPFPTFFGDPDNGLPSELTNVGGTLFFRAADATNGQELWKSNGTTDGTQLVKNIVVNNSSSYPESFLNYNGTLIFTVTNDRRFFRSDGTALGTVQVSNIIPAPHDESVLHDGLVYFIAFRDGDFYELWKSDGTTAGTILEYEFETSFGNGNRLNNFLSIADTLYFQAGEGPFGAELWALNQLSPPTVIEPATFTSTTRPTISWSDVPGAVSYEIRINDLTLGVDDFIRETVTGTSFTPSVDFGLGRFSILIRATVAGGQMSGWSRPYEFRNYLRVSPLPLNRYQGTARPTIAWNALQGAAKYDVWIDNITTGQSQFIRNANVTATSFTPSSDLPMGVYRAWVRGITADGITGYFSPPTEFVVVPAPSIIGPLNPTFSRQPVFSWNAVTGAVRYELVLRNANNGQVVHSVPNLLVTHWTPPADLPVGTYRWQVVAVSSDGYRSTAPQVITFFVGGRTDVLTPTGTTSDRTPTFSWRPVDGAAAYRIKVDRIDFPVNGIIDATSLLLIAQYTPTSPLPVGTYRVWVRAIGNFGELGLWSLPVNFQVTQTSESVDGSLVAVLPTDVVLALLTDELGSFLPAPETIVISHATGSDQSDHVPVAEDEFVTRQSETPHAISARRDEDRAERTREGILDRLMAGQSEADNLTWMF